MGKNLKILGLSLLALTAMMAVSASAAQAKWVLKRAGASVNELKLKATVEAGEFLVPNLGIKIRCSEGGLGTAKIIANANPVLPPTGEAELLFHGCFDLDFSSVCDVHSLGQPNGLILAKGKGTLSMDEPAKLYLLKAESNEFSTIVYLHKAGEEECPLEEVSLAADKVSGSITLDLLTAETDEKLHVVDIAAQNLLYGGQAAELHTGTKTVLPKGSLTEENGNTWAVGLTGL